MKKRFFGILLCFCMAMELLPITVLATDYPDGWPGDPSVLIAGTDIVTIDGIEYTYKGKADNDGIILEDEDGTTLTEACCWKAGDGYVLFTPTTTDPFVKAKLELHRATIATTNATVLKLPSTESVDITVIGDNSLTAGGSGNVIHINGQALSITGSGNLTLAGSNYGINANGAVSIEIDGDLTFDTVYQPIYTSGDISVLAKSLLSKSGYPFYSGSTVSFTATNGDIVIDDTEKTGKQEKIVGINGITLNSLKGKIDITHGGSGCYALNSTFGNINVTALNDVRINANSDGGGIYSNKTDTSSVISVKATNGSIEMNGGNFYECVEAQGKVELTAAKDITLNGSEESTSAIQASGSEVSITAGGKLSSTSSWGFQVGTLIIQVDEVSIAATSQDAVQASSLSITKDGTSNCKQVSITTMSEHDYRAAITSSNVSIKADDVLICANNGANAIMAQNSSGTVTIGDAGKIIGAVSVSGIKEINSNILQIERSSIDASTGLNLSIPPSVNTYYKAGNGYALFTPANGDIKAILTLHNANITSSSEILLNLGAETVIKLEGKNTIINSKTDSGVGIMAVSSTSGECQPVTIQGGIDDSLTVSATECTSMGALTIDGGSVTMDGMVYGIATEGNVVLKNGAKVSASGGDTGSAVSLRNMSGTEQYSLNVSDGSTLTVNMGNAVNDSSSIISGNLIVSGSGSKVTINSGVKVMVLGTIKVENSGILENNGILQMVRGTTPAQIAALKLSGNGVVRVLTNNQEEPLSWVTYANNGDIVKEISGSLDLANDNHSGKTLESDGYVWTESGTGNDKVGTLTLDDNIYIQDSIILPDETVIINSGTNGFISNIELSTQGSCNLIFAGAGNLTVDSNISNGLGGTMTVRDGIEVTVNGSVNIGTSGGANGTLNVMGSGAKLNVSSPLGYAILFDKVNVINGGSLTASAEDKGSIGVQALSGGVHVTGGSTLRTGCDYGVYIINGKLEVDSSSKLITNGKEAPFCIEGVADSTEKSVFSLGVVLPKSTEIASKEATNGSGVTHKYWSLVPAGGSLSVLNPDSTPVTLTGAVKGQLTFQKKASDSSSYSSEGSGSITRTLTFDTNGGTEIPSVSKTRDTSVELKGYKPTRSSYIFAGWYSDEALTKEITSVRLTVNTTIYAKWIKSAEPADETIETKNPFTDVGKNDYFYDAVQWSVEKNITSGTTSTTFSPSMICTRAQMVTFMWRAMGSPEPTATNCSFTDVSKNDYYYKAVLWAVENSITAGATATTFAPNATVTRGQIVTFLWRGKGKPKATSENPFTDVEVGAYNYEAILWAAEKGITQGTTLTTFSSDTPCTRGQILTFLYRYMEE